MNSVQTSILVSILVNTVFWLVLYMRMVHYVRVRGGKVTLVGFKFMYPVITQYRKLYAEEIAPGSNLFPMWLISINLNLLLVVVLMLSFFLNG